jgi:hypothetical protein
MILRNRRTIIRDHEKYNEKKNEVDDSEVDDSDIDDSEIFYKNKITEEYIKYIYKGFLFCFEYTYKGIKIFIKVSGIYIVWIFLHYIASHLYVKLCVPNTIIGFLMSPFMTATPHCQGLRWIVYNASNMINNMWLILGSWICSLLLIMNRDGSSPTSIPVHISPS